LNSNEYSINETGSKWCRCWCHNKHNYAESIQSILWSKAYQFKLLTFQLASKLRFHWVLTPKGCNGHFCVCWILQQVILIIHFHLDPKHISVNSLMECVWSWLMAVTRTHIQYHPFLLMNNTMLWVAKLQNLNGCQEWPDRSFFLFHFFQVMEKVIFTSQSDETIYIYGHRWNMQTKDENSFLHPKSVYTRPKIVTRF